MLAGVHMVLCRWSKLLTMPMWYSAMLCLPFPSIIPILTTRGESIYQFTFPFRLYELGDNKYASSCYPISILGRIIRVTLEVDVYREWIRKNWARPSRNELAVSSMFKRVFLFIILCKEYWKIFIFNSKLILTMNPNLNFCVCLGKEFL